MAVGTILASTLFVYFILQAHSQEDSEYLLSCVVASLFVDIRKDDRKKRVVGGEKGRGGEGGGKECIGCGLV